MESRLYHVARRYIVYREKRRQIHDQTRETFLDVTETIDSYLNKSDWRVSGNENMADSSKGSCCICPARSRPAIPWRNIQRKSVRPTNTAISTSTICPLAWPDTAPAGPCAICLEGFNLDGRCSSGPPRHLDAAMGQMVNFLGTLQNEWAGAQAFNNVDTYLAPFVRHDGLSYDEVSGPCRSSSSI